MLDYYFYFVVKLLIFVILFANLGFSSSDSDNETDGEKQKLPLICYLPREDHWKTFNQLDDTTKKLGDVVRDLYVYYLSNLHIIQTDVVFIPAKDYRSSLIPFNQSCNVAFSEMKTEVEKYLNSFRGFDFCVLPEDIELGFSRLNLPTLFLREHEVQKVVFGRNYNFPESFSEQKTFQKTAQNILFLKFVYSVINKFFEFLKSKNICYGHRVALEGVALETGFDGLLAVANRYVAARNNFLCACNKLQELSKYENFQTQTVVVSDLFDEVTGNVFKGVAEIKDSLELRQKLIEKITPEIFRQAEKNFTFLTVINNTAYEIIALLNRLIERERLADTAALRPVMVDKKLKKGAQPDRAITSAMQELLDEEERNKKLASAKKRMKELPKDEEKLRGKIENDAISFFVKQKKQMNLFIAANDFRKSILKLEEVEFLRILEQFESEKPVFVSEGPEFVSMVYSHNPYSLTDVLIIHKV